MNYIVRPFNFSTDRDALYELWQRGLRHPSENRLKALYRDNSYGSAVSWLLWHNKEQLVGVATILPRNIRVDGRKVFVGVNCDILVEKGHRTLGPALMILRALVEECEHYGYQLLLAMPNEKSVPVFKRIGYQKAGTAHRWARILRVREKLSPWIKNDFLRKACDPLANLFFKACTFDVWWGLRYFKTFRNMSEKTVKLDDFSISSNDFSGNRLERSARYLAWRYSEVFYGQVEIFTLVMKEQLFGYVIYSIDNGDATVQDIFTTCPECGFHVLLSLFIEKMYKKKSVGSISILLYGSARLQQILRRCGFIKREGRDIYVNIVDPQLSCNLSDISDIAWFDGDLDL